MKSFGLIFIVFGSGVLFASAQPESSHFTPAALRVVTLTQPVRSAADASAIGDLWSLIPKDIVIPHFDDSTTDGWIERFDIARHALVASAKELKLEAEALDRIFDIISKKDRHALLPLIALRAEFNGKQVWIIYLNWEMRPGLNKPVMTKDGPQFIPTNIFELSHVRAYAFTIDSFDEVAFNTCL
jgi:hypothetical protein